MSTSLHPNGAVSSVVALAVARQVAENSLVVGATTDNVAEGNTNFYFTSQRARNSITGNLPITYNTTTGIIGIKLGSSNDSVCAGNDARLSNARTPLAHNHTITDITNLQTELNSKASSIHSHNINSITNLTAELASKEPVIVKNTAFNKDFGNTAGSVCEGNDIRLSDARTPVSHSHSLSDISDLSGFTGSISVVTSVDFTSQTVTTMILTIDKGIITNAI